MVKIELTDGEFTLVDDDVYELIKKYKWYLKYSDGELKYAFTSVNGKIKQLHRIILNEPNSWIDHINGNGLDNRIENLRLCTPSQNQGNRKINKNNTSGYRGVYKFNIKSRSGKVYTYWVSSVHGKRDGKRTNYHHKTFKNKNDAINDHKKALSEYFGEFIR